MDGSSSIIGKGLIALFIIGIIYLSLTPVVSNLAEDESLWSNATDPASLFLRDNTLMVFYFSGVAVFFIIIIWMFSAVTSRGAVSSYEY